MECRQLMFALVLTLSVVPATMASTTWYVDGVHGSDSNSCKSAKLACKSIVHAISRLFVG
jgi:hypothetical protein